MKYKKYIVGIVFLSSCNEKKFEKTHPYKGNSINSDTLIERNSSPGNKNAKLVDELGLDSNKNGNQNPEPQPSPVLNKNRNQNPEPQPDPVLNGNGNQNPEPQPSPVLNGNENIQVKNYKEITGLENIDKTKAENLFKNNPSFEKDFKNFAPEVKKYLLEYVNYPLPKEFLEQYKNAKNKDEIGFVKFLIDSEIFSVNKYESHLKPEAKIKQLKKIDDKLKYKKNSKGETVSQNGLSSFNEIFKKITSENKSKLLYFIEFLADSKLEQSEVVLSEENLSTIGDNEWIMDLVNPMFNTDQSIIRVANILKNNDKIENIKEIFTSNSDFQKLLSDLSEEKKKYFSYCFPYLKKHKITSVPSSQKDVDNFKQIFEIIYSIKNFTNTGKLISDMFNSEGSFDDWMKNLKSESEKYYYEKIESTEVEISNLFLSKLDYQIKSQKINKEEEKKINELFKEVIQEELNLKKAEIEKKIEYKKLYLDFLSQKQDNILKIEQYKEKNISLIIDNIDFQKNKNLTKDDIKILINLNIHDNRDLFEKEYIDKNYDKKEYVLLPYTIFEKCLKGLSGDNKEKTKKYIEWLESLSRKEEKITSIESILCQGNGKDYPQEFKDL
jgi:hypothetical protein